MESIWGRGTAMGGVFLLALVVIAIRIAGPSDLSQNIDQSITMGLMADVGFNDQWIVQQDTSGARGRKPPLVHWAGGLVLKTGISSEWGYKLPSILSALFVLGITVGMGTFFASRLPEGETPHFAPWQIGALSGLVWMASRGFLKHCYFLRPDMLNTALLMGSWAAGTFIFLGHPSRRLLYQLMFWLAIGLAGLTKGPFAAIGVIYIVAMCWWLDNGWKSLNKTGILWGLPLAVGMLVAWLGAAYLVDDSFLSVTMKEQGMEHLVGESGLGGYLAEVSFGAFRLVAWILEDSTLFGVVGLIALWMIPRSCWRSEALGPPFLWMLSVLLFVFLLPNKGGSYLLTLFPPMSIVVVTFLLHILRNETTAIRLRIPAAVVITVACLIIVGGVVYETNFSRAARTNAGNRIIAFTQSASREVGNERVAVLDFPLGPIAPLMGRHQGGEPAFEELHEYAWVVRLIPQSKYGSQSWHQHSRLQSEPFESHQTERLKEPVMLLLVSAEDYLAEQQMATRPDSSSDTLRR